MATSQTAFDPFAVRSLLTLPALVGDDSSTWRLSPFETSLTSATFTLDIPQEEKLQNLQTDLFFLNLDGVSLPEIDSTTDLTIATDAESGGSQSDGPGAGLEGNDDIWVFPDVVRGSQKDGLLSWDTFVGNGHTEPNPAYLSEATGGHFGKALYLSARKNNQVVLKHANPDVLQASLRELSLGRESVFFGYDSVKAAFATRVEAYTLRDVSVGMLDGLVAGFLRLGNDMRALRSFVSHGSISSRKRVRVALSAAVGVAVYALESDMRLSSGRASSPLQLQEAMTKPGIMVASLRTLAEHCPEDTDDMTPFVQTCDTLSQKHPWLRENLQEIVARSVWSQFEAIGKSIGLGPSDMSSKRLPSKSLSMPVLTGKLFSAEVTEVLIESQEALALLKDSCPDHQLLSYPTVSRANLQWEYSWEAISKLQTKAMEYETSLKQAILNLRLPVNPSPDAQLENMRDCVEERSDLSQELGYLRGGPSTDMHTVLGNEVASYRDTLCQAVSSALSSTNTQHFDLQPDLDHSMSLSLMPLLTAQHRLLSYSILYVLFEDHDLQNQLLMQNRFQLLGDGVFASRLSHALFDSSEVSSEGRRRMGGRTGLRLQSRDTWPPASSELRLVLMGILSESISTKNRQGQKSEWASGSSIRLLECLSFAIRDLSDEDLEKCRNVDTIHALDFLALQYKPPTPLLEALFNPRSLKIYDDIFIHLLRLLRIKSTVHELVRDVTARSRSRSGVILKNHKTRLEIHRFVSTLADWVQNTVVGQKWASFAATLARVEKCLEKRDYDGVLEVGKGLEFIKSLHEDVIDDIARTLFLKRKYIEVRAVLDRTFDIVLQLAKHMRMGESADEENGNDATIRQLHDNFRKEVKNFLTYLRCNSSNTQSQRDSKGPEALMEQLAMRLDMFGFYTDRI